MLTMKEIVSIIPNKEDRTKASQTLGFPLSDLVGMSQTLSKMGFNEQFDWDRTLAKWWFNGNGKSALFFDYDNDLEQLENIHIQIAFEKGKIYVDVDGIGNRMYSYELHKKEDEGLQFTLSSIKQINPAFLNKAIKQIKAKGQKYWKEWNSVQSKLATSSLRNKVIRLAHSNPELREHLLPLLKTSGGKNIFHEWLGDLLYRESAKEYKSDGTTHSIIYENIYDHKKVVLSFFRGDLHIAITIQNGTEINEMISLTHHTKSSASKKLIRILEWAK